MAGEEEIFRALNAGSHPALDVLALLLDFTALLYVLLLYAVVLWFRGRRTLAFDLAVALLAVLVVTEALKFAIGRPRPADVYQDVRLLALPFLPDRFDPAFPSGHTSRAFVFALLVGLHERRWLPWLLPYAALVGWARIYEGAHYPTDILGGAALGIAMGLLFWKFDTWPPYGAFRTRLVGRWLSPGPAALSGSRSSPPLTLR